MSKFTKFASDRARFFMMNGEEWELTGTGKHNYEWYHHIKNTKTGERRTRKDVDIKQFLAVKK